MPEVQFMYRNSEGHLVQDRTPIPWCVRCYQTKIHGRDISSVEQDLQRGGFTPVDMAQLVLGQVPESGARIVNPHIHCGAYELERQQNERNHFECMVHYYIGIALMVADRECREAVVQQIEQQHLNGVVPVELMEDFNFDGRDWRVAAKYHGNSIDLYTLKLKGDGKKETQFFESDESTIEKLIKDFFGQ